MSVHSGYVMTSDTHQGKGLEEDIRQNNDKLYGVLNGLDYDVFNPKKDKFIFQNYSSDNLDEKYKNKFDLQKKLQLEINEDIPIIAIISRLVDQKGFDLIADQIERILNENIELVVLGTGEKKHENLFLDLKVTYKNKLSVNIKYDDILARQIYAGSDMFLMPSAFEPCGLGQLIAMKYGTVPIVRSTGGLKDTVLNYNENNENSTGFVFEKYDPNEMYLAIKNTLHIYKNKTIWYNLIRNCMKSD